MEEAEIVDLDGNVRKALSTVKITKCRYLEQSGCVGMCVNMCKVCTLNERREEQQSSITELGWVFDSEHKLIGRPCAHKRSTVKDQYRCQPKTSSQTISACPCGWSQTLKI